MEIDIVFRIAAVGILVAVLNQVLVRAGRDDQAMLTTKTFSERIICISISACFQAEYESSMSRQ